MHSGSHLRTSEQDTHTCNILLAGFRPFPLHIPEFHSLTSLSQPTLAPHPLHSPTHLSVSAVLLTLIRGILISIVRTHKNKTNSKFFFSQSSRTVEFLFVGYCFHTSALLIAVIGDYV